MIGNAHLDPVWLWDWREGHQENQATLFSALNRLEEFDDFVFTCSSAQFYAWIEDSDPELFEKIKKYEFDRFIDMADPATFIPSDTFSEPIRNIGRIVI